MTIFEPFELMKILILTAVSFVLAMVWTPGLTHFLYKHKLGKQIRSSDSAPIFYSHHAKKSGTPTMGGILIWFTTIVLAFVFYELSRVFPNSKIAELNFLTRSQTLLPLGALVVSAIVGLFDDILNIKRIGPNGGGMGMKFQILLFSIIAFFGALWFFFKLDWDILHIPFFGNIDVGWWYIPLFMFVIVATSFSVNEIDGLDGLAGGVLMTTFVAYAGIAMMMGKTDLAAMSGVIAGALFAFLWFNVPPARFFMGDTGSMSLGVTLGIIAMLTNTALLLPIIGFPFVLVSMSVIIQLTSKKFRGKKVFLSTPLHHHFEAVGWPESKVVMRFWVIASLCAIVGVIIAMLDLMTQGRF